MSAPKTTRKVAATAAPATSVAPVATASANVEFFLWEEFKDYFDIKRAEVNIATGVETFINLNTATPVRVCKEYSWNRTGVNSALLVSIVYMDCNCTVQKIEAISSTLTNPLLVCSYDIPTVTAGVVAYTQLCPSGNS